MSFNITQGMLDAFTANIESVYAQKSVLKSGEIGRFDGVNIVTQTVQEKSAADIADVRHQLKHAHRRHRARLAKRLARMEDKYAQRCLLGWDWLAEHPEHPLHIPGMAPKSLKLDDIYRAKLLLGNGQVIPDQLVQIDSAMP